MLAAPKPKQAVNVLVFIFQGVIVKVRVLSHDKAEEAVQEWIKEHNYVSYQHFLATVAISGPDDELYWYVDMAVED